MQDSEITTQKPNPYFGISAALGTPFRSDGSIDTARATEHAAWVLGQGAGGVTLFGTTGEGASIGAHERITLLDDVIKSGIGADQITTTICVSSLTDAIDQARTFQERGIRQMLVAPPYYFNDVTDQPLLEWFSDFVSATSEVDPRYILYHIPQTTDVPLSAPLVRQLKQTFGDLIYGVKDSSGEWQSTEDFLRIEGLAVLVGDERQLAKAAAHGAAGAISGMANLFPDRLLQLVKTGQKDAQIDELVNELIKHPVNAGVKALISAVHDDPAWLRMRTPLRSAPALVVAELARLLEGFSIEGLGKNAA